MTTVPIHVSQDIQKQLHLVQNAKAINSECTLIELQGSLAWTDNTTPEGMTIGTLEMVGVEKIPRLIIGNHKLEGKRVTLPTPLLLLKKEKTMEGTTYDAVTLISHKLIFKNRPEPIMQKQL